MHVTFCIITSILVKTYDFFAPYFQLPTWIGARGKYGRVEEDRTLNKIHKQNRKRHAVWVLVLAVALAAWGINRWQLQSLRQELETVAEEKLEALRPPAEADATGRIGAKAVVARPYIFFGPAVGKVSVYLEQEGAEGETRIEGYDYFLTRNSDTTWTETESGACASGQCQIDGKKVLATTGKAL